MCAGWLYAMQTLPFHIVRFASVSFFLKTTPKYYPFQLQNIGRSISHLWVYTGRPHGHQPYQNQYQSYYEVYIRLLFLLWFFVFLSTGVQTTALKPSNECIPYRRTTCLSNFFGIFSCQLYENPICDPSLTYVWQGLQEKNV